MYSNGPDFVKILENYMLKLEIKNLEGVFGNKWNNKKLE
jgi:hypothetical protein